MRTRFLALVSCTTLLAAPLPRTARAQDAVSAATVTEVRKQFLVDLDTLQSKVLALANAFPEEKYAWRPVAGVRSVSEVLMHVASEYYVFSPQAYNATVSPRIGRGQEAFQKFEKITGKANVVAELKESFDYMKKSVGAVDAASLAGTPKIFGGPRTIVSSSNIMIADLHEHLGQLIAYARMNGVTPPWSK